MCVFGAPRGYLGLANISNVGATSLPPETSPLSFGVPLSILILFGINMLCLLIFVATVVAATSTLVTFLLFLHLFFLPVDMERAVPPLRPLRQNIFNLPNGTVSQVKAIPIHDTSTRSGCGF